MTAAVRLSLACALLTGAALLATYPVLDMGTNDDWSYMRTSLDLARTGHLLYNGWATAMLGWQVYWGALFIKLFGFSFLVLRLSTLPLAMGAAALQFLLFSRFGINHRNALLGTLTVSLSPVFLPVAASFMTDVPAFFCILFSFYACARALAADTAPGARWWLIAAAVVSIVGGSARQIVWLCALLCVPSTAWLLRGKRGVPALAAALWCATLAAIFAVVHWYGQQPYAIPEKFTRQTFRWSLLPAVVQQGRATILTLFLMMLPVLIAYFAAVSKKSRSALSKGWFVAVFAGLVVLIAARGHGDHSLALAPWLPNMVTKYGVLGSGELENLGVKPVIMSVPVQAGLTLVVFAATAAFFAALFGRPKTDSVAAPPSTLSWAAILAVTGPFCLAYLLLLLPRAAFVVTVDRYLIPLAAILLIPVLRFFGERVRSRVPAYSFVVLAVSSGYAIAATHDYFATDRARLAAAESVRQAGVPRSEIQGGFEYDSWTQLATAGYMNDWRLDHPAGAFHPVAASTQPPACRIWFTSLTSVVKPRYFVVFSPVDCLAPSRFPPVRYRTWLPPFERQIEIERLP